MATHQATTPEDKLVRKRLNARLRQQRCRARKRELMMAKKLGQAQERSAVVSERFNINVPRERSSTEQQGPSMTASRYPPPHFRMPYPPHGHPAMFRGPMRHGYPPMMPHPHMMMAMQMGHMPPMSMPGQPYGMAYPMSPGRPVTVSRSSTDESDDSPKTAGVGAAGPKVRPSPNTELQAIGGMLSLRSTSESESEDESLTKKKDSNSPKKASSKPAKKRPVAVFVPANGVVPFNQAAAAPMPWPVGFQGPVPAMVQQ